MEWGEGPCRMDRTLSPAFRRVNGKHGNSECTQSAEANAKRALTTIVHSAHYAKGWSRIDTSGVLPLALAE